MSDFEGAIKTGIEDTADAVKSGDTAKAGAAIALAAVNAIGASAPPFGPAIAAIVDAIVAIGMFFASLCKGAPPNPDEAKRIWLDHEDAIQRARNFLANPGAVPPSMIKFLKDRGAFQALEKLAATPSGFIDPLKLAENPTYRLTFSTILCVQTGACFSDDELMAEIKKRFPPGSPKLTPEFMANAANIRALQGSVRSGTPLRAPIDDAQNGGSSGTHVGNDPDGGISTTAKVGIGLAGLSIAAIAAYYATKGKKR